MSNYRLERNTVLVRLSHCDLVAMVERLFDVYGADFSVELAEGQRMLCMRAAAQLILVEERLAKHASEHNREAREDVRANYLKSLELPFLNRAELVTLARDTAREVEQIRKRAREAATEKTPLTYNEAFRKRAK